METAAGKFAGDEWMHKHLILEKESLQTFDRTSKVVDPYRGVNQNHSGSHRTATANGPQVRHCSSEIGQTSGAFSLDQGL